MTRKQDTDNVRKIIEKYKNNMPEDEDFKELLYYVQGLFLSEEEVNDLNDQIMHDLFSAFGCRY